MMVEKINFNALDGVILNGILYGKGNDEIIISIHGMSSNCFNDREEIIFEKTHELGVDYFCFNNRGSEIMKYLNKNVDGKKERSLGGCSNEDVLESYDDIVAAIIKVKQMGYKKIHLQGHSLGCTKILYTYTRLKNENSELLENIKSIILLSLVDIPHLSKILLGNKFEKYLKIAEEKALQNEEFGLMPKDAFLHPVSAKSFIRYVKDNKEIDFINLKVDNNLSTLNSIKIPLFMRWGSVNEFIIEPADKYLENIRTIIKNEKADISYIDGANHSYYGKEEILANQIYQFLKNIK